MNKGLKLFKGPFLTWPDADDYLEDDSIKERVSFLLENPEYGIVRTNGYFVDEATLQKIRRIFTRFYQTDILEDLLFQRISLACASYMVRSELFLESYPNRSIYESRSGQNYQMLLPIASKSKCGFIDKHLCNILVRKDSHSRQSQSLEDRILRTYDVENIILSTFPYCDRRYEKYVDQLKNYYTRKRFNYAVKYNNIALLNEQYKILLERKAVTWKDILSYYQVKHRWFGHLFSLFHKIMNKLKKK